MISVINKALQKSNKAFASMRVVGVSAVLSLALVGSAWAASIPVTDTGDKSPAVVGQACIDETNTSCRRVSALAAVAPTDTAVKTIYSGGVIDFVTDRSSADKATVGGYGNLFRFNSVTGVLDKNFKPQFIRSGKTLTDSKVTSLLYDQQSDSLYVGGNFLQVKNTPAVAAVNRYSVAKFNVNSNTTGVPTLDTAFDAKICANAAGTTRTGACTVDSLAMVGTGATRKLAISGGFSTVAGATRRAYVVVSPATGVTDVTASNVVVSTPIFPVGVGKTPTNLKVQGISVSNDRTKMAIHGNFSRVSVNGAPAVTRQQIGVVKLNPTTGEPTGMSTWNPPALTTTTPTIATDATNPCNNNIPHPGEVVWDPSNTRFFVISWAGGGTGGSNPLSILCDSITAWSSSETTSVSNTPLFYNRTYGDTMLSGCYQNGTLYVGGHFRSLNYKVFINGVAKTTSNTTPHIDNQGRTYYGEIHWGLGAIETDTTNTAGYGLAIPSWNDTTLTGKGFGWEAAMCVSAPRSLGGGVYFGGDDQTVNGDTTIKRLVRFPASN